VAAYFLSRLSGSSGAVIFGYFYFKPIRSRFKLKNRQIFRLLKLLNNGISLGRLGPLIVTVALLLLVACVLGSVSAVGIENPAPLSPSLFIRLKAATFDPLRGEPGFPPDLRISSYPGGETGCYIVQFSGPVRPEWKEQIRGVGGKLSWYIPDYAFLVQMDPSVKTRIQSLPFVRWVGIYQPAYKIYPDLLGKEAAELTTINILTSGVQGMSSVVTKINDISGEIFSVEDAAGGMIKARVRASEISGLAAMKDVIWIEPWAPRIAFNDTARWVIQSGLSGFTPVHDNGIQGENQIVTIADTGLRLSHEMFVDLSEAVGPEHRKVYAYYVPVGAGGVIGDESGHGTHVAGTVAGDAGTWGAYDSAPDISGKHDGQAFTARIVMQDIDNYNDPERYIYPPNDYNNLFQPAYDVGSMIHSNSWGGLTSEYDSWYDTEAQMIDNFMWRHKNFQVLFAMGNEGPNPNKLTFEAQAKNAISVGATLNGASADSIISWSSRGLADDNRIKPTVVAPGVSIWSANYSGDNLYTLKSGTSMATPTAAGAVALILQYYSEGWYPGGEKNPINSFEPSSALIRATLINGAAEISGSGAYQNSNAYPNGDQGWGRVNLNNSLYFKGDIKKMWAVDNKQGVVTGQTSTYRIVVDDNTQPLEFTLAWTDYPGFPAASVELVNDLNLKVIDPNGNEYWGNVFTSYNPGYSTTGGAPDHRNVEETVLLLPDNNKFPTGTYVVEVIGDNVPEGEAGTNAQPFALVVTGGIDYTPPPTPVLVWPADGENINDNTPFLDWLAVRDNSTPVLYRVYMDNDSNFSSVDRYSEWILLDQWEVTPALSEGMWFWRVQAKDNAGNVGDNSQSSFRVDITRPPTPTPLEPADGAATTDNSPTFRWAALVDNSMPVTYGLQVDNDNDFSSPEVDASGLRDNAYTPTVGLPYENYSWRVRAFDNAGNISEWSPVRKLFIEEPGAKFSLVTLYKAGLDLDVYLENGSKLVVKFYTYMGDNQGEYVIWENATPAHVVLLENVLHPSSLPVEIVTLALTTDNTEEVISTIAGFTANKGVLFGRYLEIKSEYIKPGADKPALFNEYGAVKKQYAKAPS